MDVSLNENGDKYENIGVGEQTRIIKNVLILGVAFMLHFTAFQGAANLQSSINANESLGAYTLASIYGSLIISNIFLPAVVIAWFGCKWAISISFMAYMPFIISQFHPTFLTMIPSALAVGFGGGPLWCAKCTYLSVVAEQYSRITGIKTNLSTIRFFGLFFMLYQCSQVWGNLISSSVLSVTLNGGSNVTEIKDFTIDKSDCNSNYDFFSTTLIDDKNTHEQCGANFCPSSSLNSSEQLAEVSKESIYFVNSIYLACMALSCLIVAVAVDPLTRYTKRRRSSKLAKLSGLDLLIVTMKQLKEPNQLLLVPITMFIGAEQAFIAADYNSAFVTCGWGIKNIGFVMVCYGISNSIMALLCETVVKYIGKCSIIAIALVIHVSILLTLLLWKPYPNSAYLYFVIASFWGLCDAIWLVQINSMSGTLFLDSKEAAYSNFRLWEATGSAISYLLSAHLCTDIKIYILLITLFLGISGLTVLEYLQVQSKRLINVNPLRKTDIDSGWL